MGKFLKLNSPFYKVGEAVGGEGSSNDKMLGYSLICVVLLLCF